MNTAMSQKITNLDETVHTLSILIHQARMLGYDDCAKEYWDMNYIQMEERYGSTHVFAARTLLGEGQKNYLHAIGR